MKGLSMDIFFYTQSLTLQLIANICEFLFSTTLQ